MKKVIVLFSLILSMGTHGQDLNERLLDSINETLEDEARSKGFELVWQETRFAYALSNLAINLVTSFGITGAAALGGRYLLRLKGATSSYIQGSTAGAAALVAGSYAYCPEGEITCAAYKIPLVNAKRAKIEYLLTSIDSFPLEEVSGSCLLFYVESERNGYNVIDYEIDTCSDSFIFPQNVPGRLRTEDLISEYLGEGVGGFFDGFFGQDRVVAKGRVYQ